MISLQMWDVDYDYITTLGMKLKAGRNFSRDFPSDGEESVILNQAAAERFEFNADAIGKKISYFGGNNPDGTPDRSRVKTVTVIGVIENFHFESMRETIHPLSFFHRTSKRYFSFPYP